MTTEESIKKDIEGMTKFNRNCQFCGMSFAAEIDEYTCDDCVHKMDSNYRKLKRTRFTTNWEEPANKRRWAEKAKKAEKKLLNSCHGVLYSPNNDKCDRI